MQTFRDFLNTVLGVYTPITYDYGTESIIPDGFAGVDWPYLIRGFILAMVIYCVLRLIGGLICR